MKIKKIDFFILAGSFTYNIFAFIWLNNYADLLMFNLVSFFVIPIIFIVLQISIFIVNRFKAKSISIKNKLLTILLLLVVIVQFYLLSNDLTV